MIKDPKDFKPTWSPPYFPMEDKPIEPPKESVPGIYGIMIALHGPDGEIKGKGYSHQPLIDGTCRFPTAEENWGRITHFVVMHPSFPKHKFPLDYPVWVMAGESFTLNAELTSN